MQKKNKLMLAAAIGMVAVVVATTAVRCSIARTADEAGAEPPAAAAEQPAGREGALEGGARGEAGDGPEAIVEELRGTAWVAADGSGATLAFRDGAFVESDGASVALAAFEVEGAGSSEGPALARRVPAAGRAGAGGGVHAGARGGRRRRLGGLGRLPPRRPVRGGPAAEGGVEVTGLAEPYLELIGGDGDGLARAIGEWARANAPSAGEASFDGEVFLDTGSGRVSATFHLDDAASTIVAVSYEAGAFDVAG